MGLLAADIVRRDWTWTAAAAKLARLFSLEGLPNLEALV